MAHRMSRRVQNLQLHGFADFNYIAGSQASVDAWYCVSGVLMGHQLRIGGRDHGPIAARVIAVLVSIQDLRDLPPLVFSSCQTFAVIQGVDSQSFTAICAYDQIIEIAIRVGSPNLFNNHWSTSLIQHTVQAIMSHATDAPILVETRIQDYHMENRGDNIMTKQMLLAIGDKYEATIVADRVADAPYR